MNNKPYYSDEESPRTEDLRYEDWQCQECGIVFPHILGDEDVELCSPCYIAKNFPVVNGGQGRSHDSVLDSALSLVLLCLLAGAAIAMAIFLGRWQ